MRQGERAATPPPADSTSTEQCFSSLVVSPLGGVVDLAVSPSPAPERRPRSAATPSSRGASRHGAGTVAVRGEAVPSRFKRVLDKATGKHYYYDKDTKETFWTLAEGAAGVRLSTEPEDPRKRRKTYGIPPTGVEAVAQNQGAVVWWKVPPPSGEDKRGSAQTGGGATATKSKATTIGGASGKGVGGGGAGEEGLAGDGGKGSIVVGTGARGSVVEEDPAPKTVGFVVYRYRLDGREWHKKGATNVDGAKAASASIKALSNGLVYRFTVASRTEEGVSAESEPCVAVRPNEPLPEGWKEKFNAVSGKSVYTNVKTGQTSLERPESDPYFVETDLFLKFTPEETEALCEEFRTRAEMQSSTMVAIDDLMDILPRIGEPLREVEVVKRLKEAGWEQPRRAASEPAAGATDLANVTYRLFLALLWGIKGPKVSRRSLGRRLLDTIVASLTPGSVSSKKLALIEQDPGKRMGNWEKLVHPVARRPYFVNKDTGQTCWDTPAEVKFFLNDKLRRDLLKTTFSEEELAGLQKAFGRMDLDGNGSIDADELGLVLKSYGEAVPPGRLKALIREVDRDGSDCVDFEEFTVMMSAVKKGKASLGWGRINKHLQDDDDRRFDGLKGQFEGIKAMQKASAVAGSGVGGANHGKFCLCGCRGIRPTSSSGQRVVYKDWRTTKMKDAAAGRVS